MNDRSRQDVVDTAVVVVLSAIACVGLSSIYGGSRWVVAATGGVALGVAVASLGAWRHLPAVVVTVVAVLLFLLLGPALALPASSGLPTPEALRSLMSGAVRSWRDVLTLTPPLDGRGNLLVPALVGPFVTAALSQSLALRLRGRVWTALLPPVALLGLVGLLGTDKVLLPVGQGVGLLVVGLAWVTWRRRRAAQAALPSGSRSTPAARQRALVGAAIVLAAAGIGGVLAPALAAPERQRFSLREVVQPPLDPRAYPSPLVAFRKYVKDLEQTTLFTVEGLPAGARVRLATLDSFDGVVWEVAEPGSGSGTGRYSRVGEQTGDRTQGVPAKLKVTVEDYSGVWNPTVGQTAGIAFEGPRAEAVAATLHYNAATGTALTTRPLSKGDTYVLDAVVAVAPTDSQLAGAQPSAVTLPQAELVPPAIVEVAGELAAEAATPVERARALQKGLAQGYFSHGLEGEAPSRAGHGADRLSALLAADQLIGDQEQYAPAMALMARQLGLPSRVVMGFVPKGSGTVAVKGGDVSAWVEVAFAGQGWVTFDPTPDETRKPQAQAPKPRSKPRPQVQQPPPPVEEPAAPLASTADDPGKPEEAADGGPGILVAVGKYVVLPLLLVLGPCVLVIAWKLRRRRRRAREGPPSTRIAGGWAELIDRAADLGTRTPPKSTRRETARALQQVYEGAGAVALAERADAGVFAPDEPTDQDVAAFWAQVEASLRDMHASVSPWRRLRARLSLASVRKG